ncbi:MAG: 3,4-dihydroxy-2-butanone-4-phosphate synthase [Candidatus Thermoplasmatota archaeon]|nr:3,4-dihydroxy-2-butanone-4-phosphate synthase [Candidatus Thermoplasmatota archaeon]
MKLKGKIEKAVKSIQEGNFILVYDADGREEETDFIIGAEFVSKESIYRMRHDGGGLIFLMVHRDIGDKLGLPYLSDVFYRSAIKWPVLKELIPNDIPYDTKSSFSITINHRKTFTGITDVDRAMTMREFAKLASCVKNMGGIEAQRTFGENFRAPGHVPICMASEDLLQERRGHTELSVALAVMANITPITAGCEMMDYGNSLPKKDAAKYAEENKLVFLEGQEIVEAWEEWQE